MYIERSATNHGTNVFCGFERTDVIHINKITFYNSRYSRENNHKAIGSFRIQILLEDNTWSTRYIISKNDRYSNSSTDWTLVNSNFTIEN